MRQRWRAFARGRRGAGIPTLLGWLAAALVVLGVVWVVVTGLVARSDARDAQATIGELRAAITAGDAAKTERLAERIRDDAASAHALTSGPAWWVSSNIPVLGSPLRTARVLGAQVDVLGSQVLPGVIRLAQDIARMPPPHDSTIDLSPLRRAEPVLQHATDASRRAIAEVDSAPGSWLGPVTSARSSFLRQLNTLTGEIGGAARAVRIVTPMLGDTTPHRYFIGFLNEAEARGGGGIPGAYAVATADHGRITFESFGSDNDMVRVRAKIDLGEEFDARYRQADPYGVFQNSNLSPDFTYAARIWAGMWKAKSGRRIDGAIAIDPTALGYLLGVTGPARLADGTVVSAETVVGLTQKGQYAKFAANTTASDLARKQFLIGIARGVSERLTSGGNAQQLIKALSRAAKERRLTVWSAEPGLERELVTAGWAGVTNTSNGGPFSAFVVNNAAGSKLDYYLDRTMSYVRSDCGAGGRAVATLDLVNRAPASGLPPYVTTRIDGAPSGARPGDNSDLVTYYAASSAQITGVTLNGKPLRFVAQPEGDTIAVTFKIELPVGQRQRVAVTVLEPAAIAAPRVLEQPLVRPLDLDLRGNRCR